MDIGAIGSLSDYYQRFLSSYFPPNKKQSNYQNYNNNFEEELDELVLKQQYYSNLDEEIKNNWKDVEITLFGNYAKLYSKLRKCQIESKHFFLEIGDQLLKKNLEPPNSEVIGQNIYEKGNLIHFKNVFTNEEVLFLYDQFDKLNEMKSLRKNYFSLIDYNFVCAIPTQTSNSIKFNTEEALNYSVTRKINYTTHLIQYIFENRFKECCNLYNINSKFSYKWNIMSIERIFGPKIGDNEGYFPIQKCNDKVTENSVTLISFLASTQYDNILINYNYDDKHMKTTKLNIGDILVFINNQNNLQIQIPENNNDFDGITQCVDNPIFPQESKYILQMCDMNLDARNKNEEINDFLDARIYYAHQKNSSKRKRVSKYNTPHGYKLFNEIGMLISVGEKYNINNIIETLSISLSPPPLAINNGAQSQYTPNNNITYDNYRENIKMSAIKYGTKKRTKCKQKFECNRNEKKIILDKLCKKLIKKLILKIHDRHQNARQKGEHTSKNGINKNDILYDREHSERVVNVNNNKIDNKFINDKQNEANDTFAIKDRQVKRRISQFYLDGRQINNLNQLDEYQKELFDKFITILPYIKIRLTSLQNLYLVSINDYNQFNIITNIIEKQTSTNIGNKILSSIKKEFDCPLSKRREYKIPNTKFINEATHIFFFLSPKGNNKTIKMVLFNCPVEYQDALNAIWKNFIVNDYSNIRGAF